MDTKQEILTNLRAEMNRWEALLAALTDDQINAKDLHGNWSVKDTMAHLYAWQQRSNARLDAALTNTAPIFPAWSEPFDIGDYDYDVDPINSAIYDLHKERPWAEVYALWQGGFLMLLEKSERISEADLFDAERYEWMGGSALAEVHNGTYEHHQIDHYQPLVEVLKQQGKLAADFQ